MPYDKDGKYYRKPVYRDRNSKKKDEIKNVDSKNFFKKGISIYWYIFFILITGITLYWADYRRIYSEKVSVQKGLKRGFEVCNNRWRYNKSTHFKDIPFFSVKYDGYEIKPIPSAKIKTRWERFGNKKETYTYVSNSCFAVEAIPKNNKNRRYKLFGYVAETKDLQYYPFEICILCNPNRKRNYPPKRIRELRGNFYCDDQTSNSKCSFFVDNPNNEY